MASMPFESQSSSPPSSSRNGWTYDVFISFRGPDTRNNFTNHLYTALNHAGFYVFQEDTDLTLDQEEFSQFITAIQESRICIVIFSKGYASSRWCLEELVEILRCKRTSGHVVLPVFYNVDSSDVQEQKGVFSDAFNRHEEIFKDKLETVKRWREAFEEAGKLPGWHLKDMENGYISFTFFIFNCDTYFALCY
jgi:hypothetical protein